MMTVTILDSFSRWWRRATSVWPQNSLSAWGMLGMSSLSRRSSRWDSTCSFRADLPDKNRVVSWVELAVRYRVLSWYYIVAVFVWPLFHRTLRVKWWNWRWAAAVLTLQRNQRPSSTGSASQWCAKCASMRGCKSQNKLLPDFHDQYLA